MKTHRITLSMESSRTSGRIDVIESDSGRKIRCNIGDMKIPDGSTARIYARKPSGLEIYNDCTIEDGCVIVELTTQMTAEQGSTRCQVEITNSGENVTSFEFELRVHAKLKSSGSVESTNEFTALENALANAQNFATDQTLTMAGQAADAKVVGNKFSQLSEEIGDLSVLDTEDKSSIVAAINELLASGGGTSVVRYTITKNLTNVSSSNSAGSVVEGKSYTTTLSVTGEEYSLGTPVITMGGVDITSSIWDADTATITIPSVTGDVVITCVGVKSDDTSPNIQAYDTGWNANGVATQTLTGTYANTTGLCILTPYEFTLDVDALKTSSVYDAENNYFNISGSAIRIHLYTPYTKYRSKGYGYSGLIQVTKNAYFGDDSFINTGSNNSYNTDSPSVLTFSEDRYRTEYLTASKISFSCTLSTDDLDDSYAYFTSTVSGVMPVGIREGDIIFAGKNTPYYGMSNIDGTLIGEQSTSELSIDDDNAMDYSIATTSILGEEVATDTQTAYGISISFASVIDEVRTAWMEEYGGDYRKIPIIVSTDQHGRKNSGIFNMLGKVLNMHDVSKVMNLGDTVAVAWNDADTTKPLLTDTTLDAWLESIKAIPYSKRLDVFGNHDTWYGNYADKGNAIGTRYPSSQAHLNQYFRNIYARRTNNNGWFVVYDDQFNVKYVVVSAFEYQNSATFRIGTAQMTWLIAELSKNDGYDVVIVSHVPLFEDPTLLTYPTGQTSTKTARISELDTDAFFSARKIKGSGTIVDSDGVTHNYDFTACENPLLCSLHGHTHYDAYLHLNDSLLVNAFDWFDGNTFFFVLIDRVNNQLNVWKVEGDALKYINYQIPFDKPTD